MALPKKEPKPELLHAKLMEMTKRAHKAERELARMHQPVKVGGTLKLCPFCGSMPLMDTGIVKCDFIYWVQCESCNAIGPEAKDRDKAESLWNTRFVYQKDTQDV